MPVPLVMRRHWIATTPQANLFEAERLMRLARVRQLPVVVDGILVGVLANRELLRVSLQRLLATTGDPLREGLLAATPVATVMDPHPLTVEPDATIREAAALMIDGRVGCLPVVATSGRMVGLVVEGDLLRCAYAPRGAAR